MGSQVPLEIVGLGAVALALIGLVTKMWSDSNRNRDEIIKMVRENTCASVQQSESNKDVSAALSKHNRVLSENLKLLKTINGRVAEAVTNHIKKEAKNGVS